MLKISTVSFPGLGIDNFELNSVAFSIGNFDVAWYGLFITIGMILAIVYVLYRAKQVDISADKVLDFALFTIPIGVLGARLMYVLTSLDNYIGQPFWKIFAINEGGLAIYGGIIAGAITVLCVARYKKIPFFRFVDCAAPAVLIGQALGRWGNFMNAEAYGSETTLPWRMGVMEGGEMVYVHPTFFYESLWNVIGIILINIFYRRRKYEGEVTLWVFGWYGFGRMFIEILRSDSLYICSYHAWFTKISVLIGFAFFAISATLFIYHRIKKTDLFGRSYLKEEVQC